jgi:large subunit ribosomal protein L46
MKQRNINEDHEAKAKAKGLGWRIVGSTILHRYPTITPDPLPWEIEYWDLQDKIADKKREWIMGEVVGTDAQFFAEENPTIDEIVESMPFKPASRITEADTKNDRHSLERHLPNSMYLIVKRNRADNAWQFPQGKVLDTEKSMREVAERVLDRAGGKFRRWFISNAPIGYYCYEYPEEIQKARNQYGAKVFFYRAQLIAGSIKLETKLYKDYAWVTRDEVSEYFDENMSEYIKAILPLV